MSWSTIVNKGSSGWVLINANQPNSALADSYCNAVPDVDDWTTLSDTKTDGHVVPLRKVVRAQPPHLPEDTLAYDVQVRILFQYGNQYRGKGMFIKKIWTDVLQNTVGPGYEVSMAFWCSEPWSLNPDPSWPAASINLGVNAQVVTKKYQKSIEKWRYNLSANGSLVIV